MTPGNYSVHFDEWRRANSWRVSEEVASQWAFLSAVAEAVPHFQLPEGGKLLELGGRVHPDMVEALRPPYPQMVYEYANPDWPASKCFAIVDSDPGRPFVNIYPIVWDSRHHNWIASCGFRFSVENALDHSGHLKFQAWRLGEKSPPALEAQHELVKSFGPVIECYAGLCLTLSCVNVETETLRAPEQLNKARARKGKPRFLDYHVLSIPGRSPSEHFGDPTGRTVRTHLRRGHIRRLPSKRVWVNATVVHGGSNGFVNKDYRIAC